MATDHSPDQTVSLLLSRGQSLLSSLSALQRHLRRTSLDRQVEVRPFATALRSELSFLESLEKNSTEKGDAAAATATAAPTTSNLSHLELIWRYARTQLGVRGICKTFSYHRQQPVDSDGKKKKEKKQVMVDVVSQNGLTWTKVCGLSPSRIRRPHFYVQDVDSLVRNLEAMLAAAKNERVQYLHPEVVVYFPNLTRADADACDVLDRLGALGVTVRLADDEDLVRQVVQEVDEEDEEEEEMVRPVVETTDTVNLDVTALLSLVSDITHDDDDDGLHPVTPQPWFHPAISAQLNAERNGSKMGRVLFPALRGKGLVASSAAKKRFCQIVDIFGSETEKERMELVLNGFVGEEEEEERRRAAGFGGMDLKFPVKVVEDEIVPEGDVQAKVAAKLSTVNRAVFMTGWKKGFTTVTSNRTIAKAIEGLIEDGEQGPDMLVLNASRSLVGKGKSIDV